MHSEMLVKVLNSKFFLGWKRVENALCAPNNQSYTKLKTYKKKNCKVSNIAQPTKLKIKWKAKKKKKIFAVSRFHLCTDGD